MKETKAPYPESPKTDALDRETHEQAAAFDRIMSRAVREAQEESRRMGVPNVYAIGGVIHYEHPDGTLSTDDPYEK
jgi:hypothetical protein